MSGRLTPGDVLHRLPDWQGASWTALSGGLSNRTWQLQKEGRKAVLKIDAEPREAPYSARHEEAGIQSAAAKAGLANPVLFVDDGIYLTEFVDGTVWKRSTLDSEQNLERLARSLKRLHALPLSGRSFDAVLAAKRYAGRIGHDLQLVAKCTDIVRAMRLPQHLCCCHNDLVAENIMTMPDVRFLDWEYACDNDPFFDLATIVEHHELDEQRALYLLDVYFDGNGERWRSRLIDKQRLYLALLWLWLASRPGSSEQEQHEVAARLITSYS